jgi:hypothetical protein
LDSDIADVQIFFFAIHGKSRWRIEMICIDARGTITITFKKMKISEWNSWIFAKKKLFPFSLIYLKKRSSKRFAFAIHLYYVGEKIY